jgi:hypothetical protein
MMLSTAVRFMGVDMLIRVLDLLRRPLLHLFSLFGLVIVVRQKFFF